MTHYRPLWYLTAAFTISIVIYLAGCATIQVDSMQENAADFSAYQEFAFLPGPAPAAASDPRVNSITLRMVQENVREVLLQRGFTEVEDTQADFLVTPSAHVEREIEAGSYGWSPYVHYPGSWGLYWGSYPAREYPRGTIIIDIIDAATRQLVWRGWAEMRGADLTDPARIREAAEKTLARFPPH